MLSGEKRQTIPSTVLMLQKRYLPEKPKSEPEEEILTIKGGQDTGSKSKHNIFRKTETFGRELRKSRRKWYYHKVSSRRYNPVQVCEKQSLRNERWKRYI